jgi:hypothetical protein
MENPINNLNQLIEKVDQMKKQDKMDLSSDQDLTIAIMNLVSIEEHLVFTANKTGKNGYYDLLQEVRETRKTLLKKIIKDSEGEVWCISKHLLAASMRLMEVGTKQLSLGRKEDAQDLFKKSYDMYNLFWGINLKAVDIGDVKKIDENTLNRHEETPTKTTTIRLAEEFTAKTSEKQGFMGKLGDLVKRAVDCCIE